MKHTNNLGAGPSYVSEGKYTLIDVKIVLSLQAVYHPAMRSGAICVITCKVCGSSRQALGRLTSGYLHCKTSFIITNKCNNCFMVATTGHNRFCVYKLTCN